MRPEFGIGIALIAVAAYHLVPALMRGRMPRTGARFFTRDERPTEFRITVGVFTAAAIIGLVLVVASLLR